MAGWACAQTPVAQPPKDSVFVPINPTSYYTAPPEDGPVNPEPGCQDQEPPPRVWASGEFLIWKIENSHLPPVTATLPVGVAVVQTETIFENPQGQVLNVSNIINNFAPVSIQSTPTIPGSTDLDLGEHLGGRFLAGVWLDSDQRFGLDSSIFFLERRSLSFNSTTGNSVNQFLVNFPFSSSIFVVTPTQVATNGAITTTTQSSQSQSLPTFVVRQTTASLTGTTSTATWGAELNARSKCEGLRAVDCLLGFRYLDFHEDLEIRDSVQFFQPPGFTDLNGLGLPLNTNLPTNLNFNSLDTIRTFNHFYGAQIGYDVDTTVGRFTLGSRGKVALGAMQQTVDIGSSSTLANGQQGPGGLLSSPLDVGKHDRYRIAVVPEVDFKVGYRITPNVSAYIGYDFLYISSVVRPGEQTALATVNTPVTVAGGTNQITVNQPTFLFHGTDVWLQGIQFGVAIRY
jgi:hypothetical protein